MLCDNCHYERPPSFFKGVEEEQLEDSNQDHSFCFLSLALPHRVITGKEAEPDADYCQHLADNRFTPCFDAHPDLGTNSADLGPFEIGRHGANLQGSGPLENDFSTSSHYFQTENIEVYETQTSSKNTEAATYENNTPSSHNLVGNKISKLGHKQTCPHLQSSTNQTCKQGISRLTISKDQTNNSYYSNFQTFHHYLPLPSSLDQVRKTSNFMEVIWNSLT